MGYALEAQLGELGQVVSTLKKYNEAILRSVNKADSGKIISKQERSIQRSRLTRFIKEDLIDHVHKRLVANFSADKTFESFKKSDSLEDFLKALEISEEQIKTFLDEFARIARRDYNELKKRYGKDSVEEANA